jgi:hypothetical protein
MPAGNPGLRVMSAQVSPPSCERHKPHWSPPLTNACGYRCACQIGA